MIPNQGFLGQVGGAAWGRKGLRSSFDRRVCVGGRGGVKGVDETSRGAGLGLSRTPCI